MTTAFRLLAPFVLMGLASCGAVLEDVAPEPARLPLAADTVVIPSRPDRPRVEVTEEELQAVMRWLSPQVRLAGASGPLPPRLQVLPAAWEPFDLAQLAQVSDYESWCGRQYGKRGDCLQLLHGSRVLTPEARYKVTFQIALDSQWDGFAGELRGMVDPVKLRNTLLSALVVYMALIVVPEPVSKAAAAVLTVVLTAYLGAQTLWNLIVGWVQLVREADAARSFSKLQEAGERYGRVMGAQTARVLVMLVTAGLSGDGLAAQGPKLPGYAQADKLLGAETGGRLQLGAVRQVRSVAVAQGRVNVVVAPVAAGAIRAGRATTLAMSTAQSGENVSATGTAPPQPAKKTFKSFAAFKYAKGPAGPGKAWHHIVEQNPANVEKFGAEALHNEDNVIRLDYETHLKVNGYYSSRPEFLTQYKTVREWLKTQSYAEQREYGLNFLRKLGVNIP